MHIYRFDRALGQRVTRFDSRGAVIAEILREGARVQVGALWLEAGGVLGRHPAAAEQLLLVTAGAGTAAGADGQAVAVTPGQAVLWRAGETHETRAGDAGLAGILIEGRDLAALLDFPQPKAHA